MPHFPKPFYRASRDLYYVQLNGKQINLGRDKDEAYRRYHQILASESDDTVVVEPENASIAVLCDMFLEWVDKHLAPATYGWYQPRLQSFVLAYPDLTSRELKPYHVQRWVDDMDVGRTTRRNYIRSIKRAMKWSLQQGYISTNAIADLQAPSADRREGTVSKELFDKVLAEIPDEGFRELLTVSYLTGCRPQEIRAVEARHFDPKNKLWLFPKSESKLKRKARVVYLTDEANEICKELAAKYPEGALFRNSKGLAWKKDAIQCAIRRARVRLGKKAMKEQGVKITDDEIAAKVLTLSQTRIQVGKVVEKTKAELRCEAKRKLTQQRAAEMIPKFCLYDLRHSFATRALLNGVDSISVSQLLGHEGTDTLSKVYQHLSSNPEFLRQEAAKISPAC